MLGINIKKGFLAWGIILFAFSVTCGEEVERILAEIERNSPALLALKERLEVMKRENRTGNSLPGAELELGLFRGDPGEIGNRTNFSLRQGFDFPAAYFLRKRIRALRDFQAELDYRTRRSELLFQARQTCYELIWRNKLGLRLLEREKQAQEITSAVRKKLKLGESGVLELNRADLNLLAVSKSFQRNEIEKDGLLALLAGMNGGKPVQLDVVEYPSWEVEADFERWYATASHTSPMSDYLRRESQAAKLAVDLEKMLLLPKFTLGFSSEFVNGSGYRGLTIGIAFPFGEKGSSLKVVRAESNAIEALFREFHQGELQRLKRAHSRIVRLRDYLSDYRGTLATVNNALLLRKALELGEISLVDYLLELQIYYESEEEILDAELELQRAWLELTKY